MLKTVPIRLVTLMIPERAESGTAAKIRLSDSTENMFTAKSIESDTGNLTQIFTKKWNADADGSTRRGKRSEHGELIDSEGASLTSSGKSPAAV